MIRRLFLHWRMERALAKRRADRATYSAAAKRGAATAVHNRFNRDVLVHASTFSSEKPA